MVNERAQRVLDIAIVAAIASAVISVLLMLQGIVLPVYAANVTAPNVIATANVPLSCAISLNTFAVSFGTINPGVNTITTSQNVLDTNGGNQGTFIAVYGGNWIGSSSQIDVAQTRWSASTSTGYGSGNALTITPANTNIAIGTASSISIWFGVGVPSGQAAGLYTQNVVLINVC